MSDIVECYPGDDQHSWPWHIVTVDDVESWHCDFCGDNWEEER